MENEIMNTVEEVVENNEVTINYDKVFGAGVISGVALGVAALVACFKGIPKIVAWHKTKKEEKEVLVIEDTSDSVMEDVEG